MSQENVEIVQRAFAASTVGTSLCSSNWLTPTSYGYRSAPCWRAVFIADTTAFDIGAGQQGLRALSLV